MSKEQIVNIVNFIRGCEPRCDMDLVRPVAEQIALMKKHSLRGTFLLQYDALIDPRFTELLMGSESQGFELGVWSEIVEPLCKECGIEWRGRYPWDWHVHCGFPHGYTLSERERLVDELFEKFREVFGHYPRVYGSWLLDTHTVNYISKNYTVDALCNCKEQYGTDGYTLWGGYYSQGYYPSVNNVFMPAQTEKNQVKTPIFRMLGSDQVYQFDFGLNVDDGAPRVQGVITLEPVYTDLGGGGNDRWVDWYLRENFNGECLSFGYTQAGQENSFGWDAMSHGLAYQFARFEEMATAGKVTVETLGGSGRRYKAEYDVTPPSTVTAHTAWDSEKRSVWYSSKKYRINIFSDEHGLRIRDLHLFDESVADPYNSLVCTSNEAVYETLPIVDGNRFSGGGILSGAFFICDGKTTDSDYIFSERADGVELAFDGYVVTLSENQIGICKTNGDFTVEHRVGRTDSMPKAVCVSDKSVRFSYPVGGRIYEYEMKLLSGKLEGVAGIRSENGKIVVSFD